MDLIHFSTHIPTRDLCSLARKPTHSGCSDPGALWMADPGAHLGAAWGAGWQHGAPGGGTPHQSAGEETEAQTGWPPGTWTLVAHVRYPVMLGEVAAQAAGSPWELSPSSVRWDDRSQLQAGGFKGQ